MSGRWTEEEVARHVEPGNFLLRPTTAHVVVLVLGHLVAEAGPASGGQFVLARDTRGSPGRSSRETCVQANRFHLQLECAAEKVGDLVAELPQPLFLRVPHDEVVHVTHVAMAVHGLFR